MKRVYLFILLLISNLAFADSRITNISLFALLKSPQKYDGKIIEVTGFANIEFEGNALYLDQKSQKEAIYNNGIWIEISKTQYELKKYHGSKVVIRGIFRLEKRGHMNLWKGTLEQISKLEVMKK